MKEYIIKKNCCKVPQFIHMEITEKCNVGCSQCYCDLHKGRNMKWSIFENIVHQAHEYGIEKILLTGGEPFYYPDLVVGVKLINDLGMKAIVSSSGCGLNEDYAKKVIDAGMHEFYISLNGSKPEIHNISRGHFEEGKNAVKIIKKLQGWCGINWVARKDNLADLPDIINMSKDLEADCFHIISPKKSNIGEKEELSVEDIKYIAGIIAEDRKNGYIGIDLCFQELNFYIENGDIHEIYRNCLAGRMFFDVMVDGTFLPCRHYNGKREKFESIQKYWTESDALMQKRIGNKSSESCRENIIDKMKF